jgi:hypothetical protein
MYNLHFIMECYSIFQIVKGKIDIQVFLMTSLTVRVDIETIWKTCALKLQAALHLLHA